MRYTKLHKQHKQLCRQQKKQFLLDKLRAAQEAADKQDLRGVYQVVRALAPKQQYKRTQLRGPKGQALTRQEEADKFHPHFTKKFTASEDAPALATLPQEPCVDEPVYVDANTLEHMLSRAPLRKRYPLDLVQIGGCVRMKPQIKLKHHHQSKLAERRKHGATELVSCAACPLQET